MTDTNQDKWKKILNNLSSEEYEDIKANLKHLKSFAGSECLPLTEKQMAVMINEGSKDLKKFFDTLKLDYVNDENLKDTPMRVSSMYVSELLVGRYSKPPRIESFPADMYPVKEEIDKRGKFKEFVSDNEEELQKLYKQLDEIESVFYNKDNDVNNILLTNELLMSSEMILREIDDLKTKYIFSKPEIETMVVKNIDVNSVCSHHLISFVSTDNKESKCTIAYIPTLGSDKALLGISKLQRIGDWFGRRPQLQEELNWQIKAFISLILRSLDVMVTFTDITHYCEKTRGVESHCGSTSSTVFSGEFKKVEYRNFALKLAC